MREALPRNRYGASGIAAVALSALVLVAGCGVPSAVPDTLTSAVPVAATAAPSAAAPAGAQQASAAKPQAAGTKVVNPNNGRTEEVVPDIAKTVLLIGDSQSAPQDGWPRLGLTAAGYQVYFCGKGGTGYASANGSTGNYLDALRRGDWLLPAGTPAMIVIQGGGNDAGTGATNTQITTNADRLIAELSGRYPGTKIAIIGTLAKGAGNGGGRRTEVDTLMGTVAAAHKLTFISTGDWLTRYGLTKDLADTVHMNAAGKQALGTILERKLRELKLERQIPSDSSKLLAQGGSLKVSLPQE
ncbi:hypothetical protein PSET11_01864 [Arthrobacter ulcerisalmonis]|uniref:SGNH hydrolase-type esterase domain-containing protein n=1 Tax=Arthrobacter ulcerisalmonis TaxID=2483813 RepID=A0A3P5X9H9_9MICC|nr:SGNH/GDSL hydrolase family protein [Arthrobacter ulcerisalmonis]VDC26959.1 hypothetical protein PSET11_01864 [Arthrobacter ulcerisalmonis]